MKEGLVGMVTCLFSADFDSDGTTLWVGIRFGRHDLDLVVAVVTRFEKSCSSIGAGCD